jgi:hypothetical protein
MGVFGLVLTAVAGGAAAVVVGHVAPEPPPAGLIRAVWIAESLILAISLLARPGSCCCFFWAATG